jgi:hypothetical protein
MGFFGLYIFPQNQTVALMVCKSFVKLFINYCSDGANPVPLVGLKCCKEALCYDEEAIITRMYNSDEWVRRKTIAWTKSGKFAEKHGGTNPDLI